MELNQAINKMEQGGSADGILQVGFEQSTMASHLRFQTSVPFNDAAVILQVRADRIQYDLEELIKALTERCKKHGLHVKSSAIIELPKGTQKSISILIICCFILNIRALCLRKKKKQKEKHPWTKNFGVDIRKIYLFPHL